MPDPQTLQDELALRAQAQDPTWKQMARSGIDSGMGLFKGLTGLGDQGPAGPTATNAGALLGAGVGTLPEGLIRSFMNMPRTSAPEATGKLLGLLNDFKGLSGKAAEQEALTQLGGATGSYLPQPTKFKRIYNNMIDRVPEAANTLSIGPGSPWSMGLTRPPGFSGMVDREAKFRVPQEPNHDLELQKLMIDRSQRPTVTDPSDIQLAAQSTIAPSPTSKPPLSGKLIGGAFQAGRRVVLARSGLTEDAIRNLRTMDINEAQKLYPNMPKITLQHIRNGDSYAWIK